MTSGSSSSTSSGPSRQFCTRTAVAGRRTNNINIGVCCWCWCAFWLLAWCRYIRLLRCIWSCWSGISSGRGESYPQAPPTRRSNSDGFCQHWPSTMHPGEMLLLTFNPMVLSTIFIIRKKEHLVFFLFGGENLLNVFFILFIFYYFYFVGFSRAFVLIILFRNTVHII